LWLRIAERFHVRCVPEALVRIWEPRDRSRLSFNIEAVSAGRDAFYRKHREKLLRHRLTHRFLRQSGWWQQRYARDNSGRAILLCINRRVPACATHVRATTHGVSFAARAGCCHSRQASNSRLAGVCRSFKERSRSLWDARFSGVQELTRASDTSAQRRVETGARQVRQRTAGSRSFSRRWLEVAPNR
jgi:hypothetical protein